MIAEFSYLYSTVKNNSGVAKTFGFLPPHGRRLDAAEEFTCFGDIRQAVIRDERVSNRRNIVAFEAAIARGDITIVNTLAPILLDDSTGGSKLLVINGSHALALEDLDWPTSDFDS